jgi:hypothetical protein
MAPLAAVVGAPSELAAVPPATRLRVVTPRVPRWIHVLPVKDPAFSSAMVPVPIFVTEEEPVRMTVELSETSSAPNTALAPGP